MLHTLRLFLPALLALAVGACGGGGGGSSTPADGGVSQPTQPVTLGVQLVVNGLASPIFLSSPSGDERLFIVERPGRVRIVQNGALLNTPFLDISDRVLTNGEQGMLSLAFDSQYVTNGFFYVFFSGANGNIVVERYSVSVADPNQADPLSGMPIITIPHPGTVHYGGMLEFGPDGMLYISTGTPDPANAQNTNALLGKLLRIDVSASSPAAPYAIPSGNPFAVSGGQPEIWAYGLRNPWRYSIDAVTSLLYLSDVGEGRKEEINVEALNQPGLNYGWNIMEGSICFTDPSCNTQGLTLPVLEYDHAGVNGSNGCAVIGGYVYRGSAIPELQGRYFYSDLCAGGLRSFVYSNGAATDQVDWGIGELASVYSFGQDAMKELYVLSGNGEVFRIVRQ